MSASRLKVVPPQFETDLAARAPSDRALAFGRPEASPFQVLSEAVHSYEILQRRCETAEDVNERDALAHAQAIGEAQSIIADKQERIDYLEAMLEECRVGLQSLAREAAQQAQDLQKSEMRRGELADLLAKKTEECSKLQQYGMRLEQDARNAETQTKLTLEFAARQAEYIRNTDLKIAAETRALQQSRDDLEHFVAQARLQRRPAPVDRTA